MEYKGFKYKYLIKGDISKQLFVRSKKKHFCKSGKTLMLNNNSFISIKKKQEPKSKFLHGPFLNLSKRKKISTLFTKTL
jgi:ribosomal protein L14